MFNQPESGDRMLALLRQYGWEMGLRKLKEEIAATPDAGRRNELRFELREALRLLGKDHHGTARILDTFGMVYAARDNVHAAEEFYRQAIARKKQWDDQPGLAISYGNLGRLHLDWVYLDHAEECFLEDRTIAQNMQDARAEALMRNYLGRVALEQGQRAALAARPSEARERWVDAAGWLDASISATAGHWPISEAYARKDQALLHLAEDQVEAAEAEAQQADGLFKSVSRPSTWPNRVVAPNWSEGSARS
jgi:MalT-like TPR region